MGKHHDHPGQNDFQRDLDDLQEWQDNQYNPGYYIGSGRVPRPIRGFGKHPLFLTLLGLFWLVLAIVIIIFTGLSMDSASSIITLLGLAAIFLCGGIARMQHDKKSSHLLKKGQRPGRDR